MDHGSDQRLYRTCDVQKIISDICDFLSHMKTVESKDLEFIITSPPRTLDENQVKSLLDGLQSKIKSLLPDESGSREIATQEKSTSVENEQIATEQKESTSSREDKNIIQIKACKSEIDRRIEAYMNQKQMEVNEFNKREFSFGNTVEAENCSCARTDSVYIPRAGSRSHIKITKVVNSFGPQSQLLSVNQDEISNDPSTTSSIKKEPSNSGLELEERLQNIEAHTSVKTDSKNICERLKALENRILFLEGLSPEYFDQIPRRKYVKKSHQPKTEPRNKEPDLSISEIDSQIQMLQNSLLSKQ